MRRKTFKVLFFLRKGKLLKNGEAPICMRITVDRRMCDILIKRSIMVEHWNQAKECVKGKGRIVEELNRYIESIRARLYQIYRELEESGKSITADRIKDIYSGNDESKKTLLQLFSEHNAQCRQLIGKDFVSKTVQRYETTARYLEEFMRKEFIPEPFPSTRLHPGDSKYTWTHRGITTTVEPVVVRRIERKWWKMGCYRYVSIPFRR